MEREKNTRGLVHATLCDGPHEKRPGDKQKSERDEGNEGIEVDADNDDAAVVPDEEPALEEFVLLGEVIDLCGTKSNASCRVFSSLRASVKSHFFFQLFGFSSFTPTFETLWTLFYYLL